MIYFYTQEGGVAGTKQVERGASKYRNMPKTRTKACTYMYGSTIEGGGGIVIQRKKGKGREGKCGKPEEGKDGTSTWGVVFWMLRSTRGSIEYSLCDVVYKWCCSFSSWRMPRVSVRGVIEKA